MADGKEQVIVELQTLSKVLETTAIRLSSLEDQNAFTKLTSNRFLQQFWTLKGDLDQTIREFVKYSEEE